MRISILSFGIGITMSILAGSAYIKGEINSMIFYMALGVTNFFMAALNEKVKEE